MPAFQQDVTMFLWAFLGTLATQFVQITGAYERGRSLPARFRKTGFWIAQGVVAAVGGALAIAYGVVNPVLALHIGAATPLIVQTLAQKLPPIGLTGDDQSGQTLF